MVSRVTALEEAHCCGQGSVQFVIYLTIAHLSQTHFLSSLTERCSSPAGHYVFLMARSENVIHVYPVGSWDLPL